MKIASGKADGFCTAPPATLRGALVYGPDAGLVRERAGRLVRAVVVDPKDPFRVVELLAAELRDDPARLSDEAQAMALTGGRRVVRVRDATESVADIFGRFLADPPGDALVVTEAGNLGPRSRLRTAFETASDAGAAVPCYADEGRALGGVITETLSGAGIRVSQDAMAYLMASLGADRMVSRSELEKLELYMGGPGEVTLDDAMACVGDSAAMTIEDLAMASAGGNLRDLSRLLDRAMQEGAEPIAILRALSRHLQRLHFAAGMMGAGKSADEAVKALRPPVFFRQAEAFRAQLRVWQSAELDRALEDLVDAERRCKSTGFPAADICNQTMLRIAGHARALAGRIR